jgi:biofilm PGA synthesis N-glycosyltransferase PgaC
LERQTFSLTLLRINILADIKFIVITPAKNEEEYIQKTINSIVSQTILPNEWVIVDDGSVDKTAAIAEKAARAYSWIKVVKRQDRGYRDLGAGLVDVIYSGLTQTNINDYEYLFNVDADIWLRPNYFEAILAKFRNSPRLGIASGIIFESDHGKLVRVRAQTEMAFGALKGWRRKCFAEIDGLVRGLGHEAIDCFKAMMLGWETGNFEDQELWAIHLRPMKSSIQNRYRGWARHGKAQYFMGSHPIWVLASATYHMLDRPYIIGGICAIIGYLEALLNKSARYNDYEVRKFLHSWQIDKLSQALRLK